jgi:hypothetical protein
MNSKKILLILYMVLIPYLAFSQFLPWKVRGDVHFYHITITKGNDTLAFVKYESVLVYDENGYYQLHIKTAQPNSDFTQWDQCVLYLNIGGKISETKLTVDPETYYCLYEVDEVKSGGIDSVGFKFFGPGLIETIDYYKKINNEIIRFTLR